MAPRSMRRDRSRWETIARIIAALIVLLLIAYAVAWYLGWLQPAAPDLGFPERALSPPGQAEPR